jgi:hypothetical protein
MFGSFSKYITEIKNVDKTGHKYWTFCIKAHIMFFRTTHSISYSIHESTEGMSFGEGGREAWPSHSLILKMK